MNDLKVCGSLGELLVGELMVWTSFAGFVIGIDVGSLAFLVKLLVRLLNDMEEEPVCEEVDEWIGFDCCFSESLTFLGLPTLLQE